MSSNKNAGASVFKRKIMETQAKAKGQIFENRFLEIFTFTSLRITLFFYSSFAAILLFTGAIVVLTMLLGMKGQRLLPICVHTLYNLTCVERHFKGMDRIAKALLNLPPNTGKKILNTILR